MTKMLKNNIFPRLGILRLVISDGGSQFILKQFENLLKMYGLRHIIDTPNHSQTSGHVDISNRGIKSILKKTVSTPRKNWAVKLNEALWACSYAYKTHIWTNPFNLVYGKSCHLLVELEHKVYCAIKTHNMKCRTVEGKIILDLHELEKLRLNAYENALIYKEHQKGIKWGGLVLIFNSRFRIFLIKLHSRRSRPFEVTIMTQTDAVEVWHISTQLFIGNGKRLKQHHTGEEMG